MCFPGSFVKMTFPDCHRKYFQKQMGFFFHTEEELEGSIDVFLAHDLHFCFSLTEKNTILHVH
jgi:hypothetical protein